MHLPIVPRCHIIIFMGKKFANVEYNGLDGGVNKNPIVYVYF